MLGLVTKHKELLLILAIVLLILGALMLWYTNKFVQSPSTTPLPMPQSSESPIPAPTDNDVVCGGIMGRACPDGYTCQLDGNYPDASGRCVR